MKEETRPDFIINVIQAFANCQIMTLFARVYIQVCAYTTRRTSQITFLYLDYALLGRLVEIHRRPLTLFNDSLFNFLDVNRSAVFRQKLLTFHLYTHNYMCTYVHVRTLIIIA